MQTIRGYSRRGIALLLIATFTSCATLRNTDVEPIAVDSEPAGAAASIRCSSGPAVNGTTPARLLIPRVAEACVLEISKTGYTTARFPLERGHNAQFWLNFVPAGGVPAAIGAGFGGADTGAVIALAIGVAGALGFAIDRISGRGYGHDPEKVDVKLLPAP